MRRRHDTDMMDRDSARVVLVPPGQLKPNPVRLTSGPRGADRDGFMHSIREVGILQPLLVQPDDDAEGMYGIIEGHCRWEAATELGLEVVPCLIRERCTQGETRLLQMVIDAHRSGLNPIEQARLIDELMEVNAWSAKQVSDRSGLPESTISQLRPLTLLSDAMQRAVAEGGVGRSIAYSIARMENAEVREALSEEAIAGKLTRSGIPGRVDELLGRTKTTPGTTPKSKPSTPRARVRIPLDRGYTVSVTGQTLGVNDVISVLSELVEQMRAAAVGGQPLAEVVKAISRSCKRGDTQSSEPSG